MKSLFVALALSVLVNLGLVSLYIAAHASHAKAMADASKQIGQIQQERDTAQDRLRGCEASMDEIADLAQRQAATGSDARESARVVSEEHYRRADAMLAQPPAVPGDACSSASVHVGDWLKERKQ